MKINATNNTQMFSGLLSFPKSKITLNPDNISDIHLKTSRLIKKDDNKTKGFLSAEMVTEYEYIYDTFKKKLYTPREKQEAYYHGNMYLHEHGEITMTNGDKFIFEGKTEDLGNVYSNYSQSKPIEDYFKSKSIVNYINNASSTSSLCVRDLPFSTSRTVLYIFLCTALFILLPPIVFA